MLINKPAQFFRSFLEFDKAHLAVNFVLHGSILEPLLDMCTLVTCGDKSSRLFAWSPVGLAPTLLEATTGASPEATPAAPASG